MQVNLSSEAITSLAAFNWDRVIRNSGAVPRGWEQDGLYQIVG